MGGRFQFLPPSSRYVKRSLFVIRLVRFYAFFLLYFFFHTIINKNRIQINKTQFKPSFSFKWNWIFLYTIQPFNTFMQNWFPSIRQVWTRLSAEQGRFKLDSKVCCRRASAEMFPGWSVYYGLVDRLISWPWGWIAGSCKQENNSLTTSNIIK